MQPHPLDPNDMLCFDVYTLQQAFGRIYKPLLDPLGLTYPQYLVMVLLWQGHPVTVGQIGARLGLDSSTLTPVIKRLEKAGLVRRDRDAQDERRVLVTPTREGREMQRRAAAVPGCVAAATGMSEAHISALRDQIAGLRAALRAASDRAG
ncbi:MarR family winged helix-turn-helix transcriptional regulator [Sulfitobacter sabulilitoris]|nr:MarR family transcriptional regulator [Sulfitobacter sabulilitoris]